MKINRFSSMRRPAVKADEPEQKAAEPEKRFVRRMTYAAKHEGCGQSVDIWEVEVFEGSDGEKHYARTKVGRYHVPYDLVVNSLAGDFYEGFGFSFEGTTGFVCNILSSWEKSPPRPPERPREYHPAQPAFMLDMGRERHFNAVFGPFMKGYDAVYMCGITVSANLEFFQNLDAAEQKRFFQSAKNWLEDFVGPENVIAANVHLDEKTPHLHFCHVPVTPDGRLCAKDIYTRACLKRMQSELPKYLKSLGFEIERGAIQESGSTKKHLETRDFKQQEAALKKLRQESELESARLESLKQKISGFEKITAEAEKVLAEKPEL